MTELDTIQRDIDSAYHESTHLRENVIRACKDHSALINELINSFYESSILISILLISIVNYETIEKAINQHQYLQNDNNTNDQYDQYFVNRRFCTIRIHFDNSFNRDNSFDRFRENFRFFKKCFVYEKSKC